ncbi:MAG TPA: BamA/TamA family outer membrane protein [Polyangiaceae bacterium]
MGSSRAALRFLTVSVLGATTFLARAARTEPAADGAAETQAAAVAKKPDPAADGWPDMSSFLDEKFGFLPVVMPITEPAVGYGAAGGLAFLSKPFGAAAQGLGRPSITFVGGFGTENGSWGAAAMDMRYWADDRVQTIAAAIYASVNLDFHGVGKDSVFEDHPIRYNLNPKGGMANVRYRFGDTRLWAGVGYMFARIDVTAEAPEDLERLPDYESAANIGGLTLAGTWDTRNNFFTATRGVYVEASFTPYGEWLGGDDNFEKLAITTIQYAPLPHRLYLGVRDDIQAAFGDAPFYMKPYISLRGVPVMRYQGDETASLEAELRWQFYGRWSLLGFGGGGVAWNDFGWGNDTSTVFSGGGGFRYELARAYGIHMGVDVAFSRDTAAFYIQVGSAWMRP